MDRRDFIKLAGLGGVVFASGLGVDLLAASTRNGEPRTPADEFYFVQLSDTQLDQLVADLLKFKNTPPRSGLITNFDQLTGVPGVNAGVINSLKQECSS